MTAGTVAKQIVEMLVDLSKELLREKSWDTWRTVLSRLNAGIRELYVIAGRGSGKSRIAALLAVAYACCEYRRAPGEFIYVGIFAPDRAQARVTFRYVRGFLRMVSALESMIVSETRDSIELSNGVVVEVITASTAAPRGRSYALCVVEEAAFLPTDESSDPDVELVRALRPALARVPGSLLCVIGSPYRRRGVLYDAWKAGDAEDRIVIASDTASLNPAFNRREIDRAFETDPIAAISEYGRDGTIEFRRDIETFIALDVLQAAVVPGRRELPPISGVGYCAFVDPSGGSADSFTLAIAHGDPRGDNLTVVADLVREVRPPFSPESVVSEFAALLTSYDIRTVTGDRYGGEWPRERFREHGIEYVVSELPKTDIYRDTLPLLNSGRVELLDHPRLISQLVNLERRTSRGGRDSIDHAPGSRDDVANSVCGALLLSSRTSGKLQVPAAFRACNRELSGLPPLPGRCYLFGGVGRPPGDEICRNCHGNAFVRSARAAHQERTGELIDIVEFFRRYVQLSEAMQWQLFQDHASKWADALW